MTFPGVPPEEADDAPPIDYDDVACVPLTADDAVFQGLDTQPTVDRICPEYINLDSLMEYAAVREDPRQPQVDAYVEKVQARGAEGRHGKHLLQPYTRKMYNGVALGREIPGWLSMPFMSKRARKAAAPVGTVMADISNAAFEAAVRFGNTNRKPTKWITRYNQHKQVWRAVIAKYYGISVEEAKDHLQPVLYTRPCPPPGKSQMGLLPFVECLAVEATALRVLHSAQNRPLVELMEAAGRRNPEWSAWAIGVLQEGEHRLVSEYIGVAARHGLDVVTAVIFDEVWHMPATDINVEIADIQNEFTVATGAKIKCVQVTTASVAMGGVVRRLDVAADAGSGILAPAGSLVHVCGEMTCLPFVLANLFPSDEDIATFARECGDGPFSYAQIATKLPHLQFELTDERPEWTTEGERIIIHEMRRCSSGPGHATGTRVCGETVTWYDATMPAAVSLTPSDSRALVSGLQGVHFIRVLCSACASPARKRSKPQRLPANETMLEWTAGGPSETSREAAVRRFESSFEEVTRLEVQYWISRCCDYGKKAAEFECDESKWRCPMCPTKVTTKKNYLKDHMRKYHLAPARHKRGRQGMADSCRSSAKRKRYDRGVVHGTRSSKQRCLMMRLWDRDLIDGISSELLAADDNRDDRPHQLYLARTIHGIRTLAHTHTHTGPHAGVRTDGRGHVHPFVHCGCMYTMLAQIDTVTYMRTHTRLRTRTPLHRTLHGHARPQPHAQHPRDLYRTIGPRSLP